MNTVLIMLIRGYQLMVSPWLGRCCRFEPCCSAYCLEALRVHGFFKGLGLSLFRLAKCHPFHPGGWDPVPRPDHAKRNCRTRLLKV